MRTLLVAFFALFCASQAYAATNPGRLEFNVTRNGQPFGSHRVEVSQAGNELIVRNVVALRANVGPVTAFRYEHTCTERWRQGSLQGLQCQTLKDGRRLRMSASTTATGIETQGPQGVHRFPLTAAPTSWWTRQTLQATAFIDTETGASMPVSVTPMGRETISVAGRSVVADRFRVLGSIALDVWYDQQGHWVRCAFTARGQRIEYQLTSPISSAPS
ncbi:MAG: DUF6134 family protein [Caulobacterales bacterium]|jgi:hypothetical protein